MSKVKMLSTSNSDSCIFLWGNLESIQTLVISCDFLRWNGLRLRKIFRRDTQGDDRALAASSTALYLAEELFSGNVWEQFIFYPAEF
jgi:hypothetical protein